MQHKNPLRINHYQPADGELERFTEEAKKQIHSTYQGRLKFVFEAAAGSLAALALYPEIMKQDCVEKTEFGYWFGYCYARYPDATLQVLANLRQMADERRREESEHLGKRLRTKSGRVRQLFLSTLYLVKKGGKFMREDTLTMDDYKDDRKTLKSGRQRLALTELQAGEIAQFLTDECAGRKKSIERQVAAARKQIETERRLNDPRQLKAAERRLQQLEDSLKKFTVQDFSPDDVKKERQEMADEFAATQRERLRPKSI